MLPWHPLPRPADAPTAASFTEALMTLAYDRRGDGPALVLLHGLGHHRGAWDPLLPRLTRSREVIAVDLPGHGASAPLRLGLHPDLDSLLDALRAFFAELGLDRPHVAGNSLGGLLAIELARRGDACSATALAPAGFWRDEAEFARISRRLRAIRTTGRLLAPVAPWLVTSPVSRSLCFAAVCARPWRLTPQAALRDARAMQDCCHFDALLTSGAPYADIPRPSVPVLVAWGTRDRILPPRHAVRARELLPDARHVLLPGCGHVPMTDAPARVAALLLEGSAVNTRLNTSGNALQTRA